MGTPRPRAASSSSSSRAARCAGGRPRLAGRRRLCTLAGQRLTAGSGAGGGKSSAKRACRFARCPSSLPDKPKIGRHSGRRPVRAPNITRRARAQPNLSTSEEPSVDRSPRHRPPLRFLFPPRLPPRPSSQSETSSRALAHTCLSRQPGSSVRAASRQRLLAAELLGALGVEVRAIGRHVSGR